MGLDVFFVSFLAGAGPSQTDAYHCTIIDVIWLCFAENSSVLPFFLSGPTLHTAHTRLGLLLCVEITLSLVFA